MEKIKHLPLGVGALPLSTDTFSRHFTLFIFLLHLNLIYVYETDFHLASIRNIISKSSYNWFKIYKIDIFKLLPPLATN